MFDLIHQTKQSFNNHEFGEIVKSHRLVLAGLSPVFQFVLKMAEQDPTTASTDEETIILPDVSSKVLLLFLDSVYKGKDEVATIDEEINYLQFFHEQKQEISNANVFVESKLGVIQDIGIPWEDNETSPYRSKRSFVWEYFSPVGKQNAQCNMCKKVQKVEKSSTTYLIRHLKSYHRAQYIECRKKQNNEEENLGSDHLFSQDKDMEASTDTSFDKDDKSMDVEHESNVEKTLKPIQQPLSKFRSLTNQISKLAKSKSTLDVQGTPFGGGRRKRSLCWKYFSRATVTKYDDSSPNNGGKECQCNICGQSFPLSSSKSTILMLRHLRKDHREVFVSSPSSLKSKSKNNADNIKQISKQAEGENTLNSAFSDDSRERNHEPEKQDDNMPKTNVNRGSENLGTTSKSMKRKQNATLREQKELREKALVMFSKPTKPRVKTPSVAWIFFDVINKDTARCIICESIVPTPLWNTNGLLRHLKKDHLNECEQWEAENVQNFNPDHVPAGQISPIWHYFKKIDDIVKEGTDGGSYACNSCDIVHVGIVPPQQIYILEAHLKQYHPDDICREYEMEKVAILCRKRKEEMKVVSEEENNIVSYPVSQGKQAHSGPFDSANSSSATSKIMLHPHEIIQDIRKGLLNILAADFFSQFSRDTMQCKLCSASCKVLTNGPNRSNNLWKHLSVSHVDIHERLEEERETIAKSLKRSNPSHPIWKYFSAVDKPSDVRSDYNTLAFLCKHCQQQVDGASVEIGEHLSNVVDGLEKHLIMQHSSDGSELYNQYKTCMNKEDMILSLDHVVWIESCSGLALICDAFFEMVEENQQMEANQFRCKQCNSILNSNIFTIDIEEQKRQHVLKNHKNLLLDHMKTSKQKGMFQIINACNMIRDKSENSNIANNSVSPRTDFDKEIVISNSECICPKCDTLFVSSTALEFHDRYLHFGERPYACDECERTFVRSDELKTHKKYHTDRALQKGAMCVTCGKQFNSATARKRHENTVHLDIRNHICKMCGKKFHSPQALERHGHTHSDEKPFVCTECGAKFREKHQLTSHLRTHTGEASITCPNCPQTFKHYAARSKHKCTGDLLNKNPISGSWDQNDIEKVDVSVVTVSSGMSHQFKQKVVG